MKIALLLLSISLLTTHLLGQSNQLVQIRGHIRDKETHNSLEAVSIYCISVKDSSRVSIAFTNSNGNFILDSIPANSYILYITSLSYEPLPYRINPPINKGYIDVGTIELKRVGITLSQIEVFERKSPLRISGDTLEYSANLFKVKENALVEDLLKRIPGIQVDKDGTIHINGEIVKTIMVNGRSLFGNNDPSIISRNLQADLIDKVQLINKKINQIGQNDGNSNSNKTINIIIKNNKHRLVSGELTAAYSPSSKYAAKTNLSRFSAHQQLLFIGSADNANGALDAVTLGNGLQRKINSGISYSETFNRLTISGSYLINNTKNENQIQSTRQNVFIDSSLFYDQKSKNNKVIQNNAISTQIEYKIDSSQKITFSNQLTFAKTNNQYTNTYESLGGDSQLLGNGDLSNNDKNNFHSISNSLRYEKLFKKERRVLSIWINHGNSSSHEPAFYSSNNIYRFKSGELLTDTINQYSSNHSKSQQLLFLISYTEPITKNEALFFKIGEDHLTGSSNKSVYDYNNTTKSYDNFNDSLSNAFGNKPTQHYMKIGWLSVNKKLEYELSLSSLLLNINNKSVKTNITISKKTITILPEANFIYTIGDSKQLRFVYRKSAQPPGAIQLQPLIDNSDPLYIKRGNPDLKPMISHDFDLSYNSFNIKSLRSFSLTIYGKVYKNQIINGSWFDSLHRQIIQPINIDGSRSLSLNIGNGFKLNQRKDLLTANTKGIYDRSLFYTNGNIVTKEEISLTQAINLNYSYKDICDLALATSLNYNNIHYANQNVYGGNYLTGELFFSGSLDLPYKINISTNLSYSWAAGRMQGYNTNMLVVNSSISKMLFSQKQGVIKLQGFDLLMQNKSVTRKIQDNYIEDTQTNGPGRLFLIKFTYFLGKNNNRK